MVELKRNEDWKVIPIIEEKFCRKRYKDVDKKWLGDT
jgi:hypothetical protein